MNELILYIQSKIKQRRLAKGLTQEDLAAQSGISYKHIQKLEGSNPSTPSVFTLYKLCNALGLSLSEFFSNFPEESPKK